MEKLGSELGAKGTGFYRSYKRLLYANTGKSPQLYYDSNREPVIVMPGETKFKDTVEKMDIPAYFVSPDLWNAQKEAEAMLDRKGHVVVLLERTVGHRGDHVLATAIPKAYKDVLGDRATVDVRVPELYLPFWELNPYVRDIYTVESGEMPKDYDVLLNTDNVKLKCEPKDWEAKRHRKNRTAIYLAQLGLYPIDKRPVYVVSPEERKWATKFVAELHRPLVGIQIQASVRSRTYPGMANVATSLAQLDYGVIILDESGEEDLSFKYTIREVAALVEQCDIIVANDSLHTHLAGALGKRIIAIYGPTDGHIFCEDYEKATVIQAPCTKLKNEPCWHKLDCIPGGSSEEKEDRAYGQCLEALEPRIVLDEISRLRTDVRRILVVMLTFDLLSFTKKAIASIRCWHDYDLFVVDNESTDGTREWLKEKGIKFVSKRTSVAGAQNIGIDEFLKGNYDYMILLNNDLVLRYDALDTLIEVADETKCYGCMSTPVDNTPPWAVDEAVPKADWEWKEIVDIPAGSYSATLLSKECIEKVGKFDESFRPRYIEDNDYTLRIRIAGQKFLHSGKSLFYHALGAVETMNPDAKKNRDVNWGRNIRRYTEKWGFPPHEKQELGRLGIEWWPKMKGTTVGDEIGRIIKREKKCRVVVKRSMGGYGDIIFISVVARALKKRFGQAVEVIYEVPNEFVPLLENYPYIDGVSSKAPRTVGDFRMDLTDLEFRCELQEMHQFGQIQRPRTQIYLDVIGLKDNIKPDYFVTSDEKKWAEDVWKTMPKGWRVCITQTASNKLKTWPWMSKLADRLKADGLSVLILDPKKKLSILRYPYTFRQAAALVSVSDFVVAPDTGISNVAGALDKPVVTIFSNRDGKLFAKMFPSMIPVQGHCQILEEDFCDFTTPCFGDAPHREKENIDYADCLKRLSIEDVYKEVRKLPLVHDTSNLPHKDAG